jgi:hypothetical protein
VCEIENCMMFTFFIKKAGMELKEIAICKEYISFL